MVALVIVNRWESCFRIDWSYRLKILVQTRTMMSVVLRKPVSVRIVAQSTGIFNPNMLPSCVILHVFLAITTT